MTSPANSDRPPTYQQVLSASQQQLQKNYARKNDFVLCSSTA